MAASSHHESAINRLLPLLAAIFPLIVSILLIIQMNYRYHEPLVNLVSSNRSATQILVQILSHGLGLLQTYSVHASESLGVRLRLFKAPAKLESIALSLALSSGRIDSSLTTAHYIFTVAAVAMCIVPGALWAGALTPLFVSDSSESTTLMTVPAYTQASAGTWNAEFEMRGHNLWNLVQHCHGAGLISNCPVPALQGLLLSSMGSASTSDGLPRQHSKNDSPQWSYVGRSYGVGASAGLVGLTAANTSANTLEYLEFGYVPGVSCVYNASSAYYLQRLEGGVIGPTGVSVYSAGGYLPNSFDDGTGTGTGEAYSVVSSSGTYTDILAWSARTIGGESFVSIATGIGKYTAFNTTQCKVVFQPSAFDVTINMTSKTITVTPAPLLANSTTLLPNSTVTTNAINSLNLISRMSGTLYSSVLGDALTRNLATVFGTDGLDPSSVDVPQAMVLSSLEDSFTAFFDDVLVAFGAAQIDMAQDTRDVPVRTTNRAIAIGDKTYIYIVLAMSVALLGYHLFVITRNRFWAGLQLFNPFDFKSVVVAASAGGRGIAQQLESRVESASFHPSQYGQRWAGKDYDAALSKMYVEIKPPGDGAQKMPIIVAAEGRSSGWARTRYEGALASSPSARRKGGDVRSGETLLLGPMGE